MKTFRGVIETMMARRGLWLIALLGIVTIFGGCSLGTLIPGMGGAPVVSHDPEHEVVIPASDQELLPHVPSQLMVKLTGEVSPEEIVDKIGAVQYESILSFKPMSDLPLASDAVMLTLPTGVSLVDVWRELEDLEGVEYAEPNYIFQVPEVDLWGSSSLGGAPAKLSPLSSFPNDPDYGVQWGLKKINAEAAWEITTGSEDVVIAILDTGIDLDHVELQGKIIGGYNAVDPDEEPIDRNNHGTHVAGIAAAPGNDGIGMAGVAWKSPLLAVKVMRDDGRGTTAEIIDGVLWVVDWAKQNPDKRVVINMSLGGTGYVRSFKEAIDAAIREGIVIVAAMGNDFRRIKNYPAAHQGVIAVGATRTNDSLTDFSTIGSHISVTAPGDRIHSTVPGDKYLALPGTSMASPFVAGAAALLLAIDPDMSPAEVKSVLEETAVHPRGLNFDENFGYGRIDLEAALKAGSLNKYGQVVFKIKYPVETPVVSVNVTLFSPDGTVFRSELMTPDQDAVFWVVPPDYGYTAEVAMLLLINDRLFWTHRKVDPFLVTKGYNPVPVTFTF